MSKTILIVGGGYGQLPAIHTARELGWRSVVVDRRASAPGMGIADEAHEIDVLDSVGVVDLARQARVDGVITLQSDIGVPTVGAVVDALGLPGVGEKVGRRCSNKIETRRWLTAVGIRQPGYRVIRTKVEAQRAGVELGFPCVVKAPASSGSRGVVKVNDIAEMPMAFEEAIRYAPEGDLLVEEYVRGTELGAQTFSYEGRCQLVLLHNDTVSEPPYMVPTGHSFPVGFDHETRVKVEEMVARCIEVVGIGVGPANIDLIVDEAGEVQILEIGVRIGATCLPELVQCFTGIDWVKETLRAAVGERPDLRVRRIQPCAASILYAKKDGVLVAARVPQEVLGLAGVLEVEVTAHAGDAVSRLRKGTDRIGKVMVQGRSASEAEILASRVFDLIEFEVATNPTAEES